MYVHPNILQMVNEMSERKIVLSRWSDNFCEHGNPTLNDVKHQIDIWIGKFGDQIKLEFHNGGQFDLLIPRYENDSEMNDRIQQEHDLKMEQERVERLAKMALYMQLKEDLGL